MCAFASRSLFHLSRLAWAALLGAGMGLASASPVTYVGNVTSSTSLSGCWNAAHAGDGSGLSGAITDGVTPWTTAKGYIHANANPNQPCTSGIALAPSFFTLDLLQPRMIDALAIWAGGDGPIALQALTNFALFSDNDNDWSNGVGAGMAIGSIGPNFAPFSTAQEFQFMPMTTQYLHLYAYGVGAQAASIGELAARGDGKSIPEPSSVALAGLGLVGLATVLRRSQR